jgi:uncharacterized protein
MALTEQDQQQLITLAWNSIDYSLKHSTIMPIELKSFSLELQEKRATFVTLKLDDDLRGCIGAIDPVRPLAEDVVHNAYASAFRDPRFSPLSHRERKGLDLAISVLSLREYLEFSSEEDLLKIIRPDIDGLVLEEGYYCGAFLPVMWEQLPTPKEFMRSLKRKAGLDYDYWSDTVRVSRFTAEYYLQSDGS